MPLCYEKNKKHIYAWREANKEKSKELTRKHAKTFYDKECYYSYERITKQFRKMEYLGKLINLKLKLKIKI